MAREVNATFAIAWREVLRAVKSPVSIAFTVVFPVIFIGVLGGSITHNLSGALPYAYLPFMLIGMIANTMYQGTIAGVTNLVEERENDFTAELFVAPISRYAVLLGKLIGSGIAALDRARRDRRDDLRHADPDERGRPAPGDRTRRRCSALAGGALGVFFIGFIQDPKVVGRRGGAPDLPPDVPVRGAHPGVGVRGPPGLPRQDHADDLPIDLARNIFYWGKPEYALAVLHPWTLDLAVTVGLLPRLHDRRDIPLRPRRPEPLRATRRRCS